MMMNEKKNKGFDFSILDQFVQKKMVFHGEGASESAFLKNQDVLHIAYGIDENFVRPMGVAMTSVVENNPDGKFMFHVVLDCLSEEGKTVFQRFSDKYATVIVVYFINGNLFDILPQTDHFTKAMYNRILLPKILENSIRRVIYLDADILCLNRLSDLVNMDFKGKIIAVVQDIDVVAKRQIQSLKLAEKRYFNSGFLYIDVEKWNQNRISERALQISFEWLEKLDWPDQDALNLALNGRCLFIEPKYNYIFDLGAK